MDEKKINIVKQVGQMYFRYGVKSVTMDEIASELGISKKTLYQNFKDKENLVEEVLNYYMENPVFDFNNKEIENPIDRIFALRKHLSTILKYYNNNLEYDLRRLYPSLWEKLHNFKREKLFRDTKLNIEEGKNQNLFREEVDSEFVAKLNVGRMLLTLNAAQGIFSENELGDIEIFDKTIDYHLHGICTDKGLKYYRKKLKELSYESVQI
ncbi:MAG: TetR/AcrR family transcriptional regulator [Prolixibacteraceae bacterium]|nr:TetR/AcrR family transcriptional regulator [Prolixibacteraceae bacterium]MBN2773332.1 TetR/AcrR family transcriptional regulator [Prolixibacteraceae bacterium]